MKLPENTDLPFFAYGIFKPSQLCFSRIERFVKDANASTVDGILKERDGIPLLIPELGSRFRIKGYVIHFSAEHRETAYKRITDIESDKVYRWQEIRCNNGFAANALVGRRELRGSSDLEHYEEWDGKDDPFFTDGLDEVENILRENADFEWNYIPLFRLQMAYMLLWSAIERYAGLKYHLGGDAWQKVKQIADEPCFAASLKAYVQVERTVFSAADPRKKFTLKKDNPKKSLEYYYQVRSNVVHRGKTVVRDFEILRCSLEELLAIFKDILNEAFKK